MVTKTGKKSGAKKPHKRKNMEVTRSLGMIGGMSANRFSGSGEGKEQKFYDTAIDNTQLSAATDTWYAAGTQAQGLILVGLAQGTGASQRIGQRITVKSIQLRLHVQPSSAASTGPFGGVFHMALVLDRDAKGTAPSITDLYTTSDMTTSMINIGYSERFRVIKKWQSVLYATGQEGGTGDYYGPMCVPIDYYHKEDIPVRYSSSTGAISEITGNNLFLVVGGFTMASASTQDLKPARVLGAARIRYVDC